jgi:serine/threonine protein kinase
MTTRPECKFNTEQLNRILKFFQDGVICDRDTTLRCDSDYEKEDSCLTACKIVRQFGQGFSFDGIMKITNKKLNTNYTSCFPSRILGSGAFGIILGIVMSENGKVFTEYALKMTRVSESGFEMWSFSNEIRMHNRFHQVGLAPILIHSDIFSREDSHPVECSYSLGVILMGKIHSVYQDYIERKKIEYVNAISSNQREGVIKQRQFWSNEISKSIERCRRIGLTHGDLHTRNIAFVDFPENGVLKRKMVFIDFGRSTDFYSNPMLDYSAVSSREQYMVPFLYKNSKNMTLPDCEAMYDRHFRDMLMVRELSSSDKIESVHPEGDAVVYKLFMTNLENHLNIIKKVYEVEINCGLMSSIPEMQEKRGSKRQLDI